MSAMPSSGVMPAPPQRTCADRLHWVALVVIAVVAIAADQVTKMIVRRSFTADDPFEVLPLFHFTNTWNTGIAFGQFRDNQIIVIAPQHHNFELSVNFELPITHVVSPPASMLLILFNCLGSVTRAGVELSLPAPFPS